MSATSEPDKVSGYIANCVREGPAKARLCITFLLTLTLPLPLTLTKARLCITFLLTLTLPLTLPLTLTKARLCITLTLTLPLPLPLTLTKARLCITVAGPQPVLRALKAVFLARHHLAEAAARHPLTTYCLRRTTHHLLLPTYFLPTTSQDKLDLSIIPEFGKSDEGVSLVNIFVLSHAPGARL